MSRKRAQPTEPTLPGKITAISAALRATRTPHAFGGAIALAYYARPRATVDIDLNVFVAADRFERIERALAPLGIDTRVDPGELTRSGQCRLAWGRTPVDLFFANLELHSAMREDLRRVPFADTRIPILAPQHLIVRKAMCDRPKDWLDIEQMALTLPDLDAPAAIAQLDRLLGPGDSRVVRLTEVLTI